MVNPLRGARAVETWGYESPERGEVVFVRFVDEFFTQLHHALVSFWRSLRSNRDQIEDKVLFLKVPREVLKELIDGEEYLLRFVQSVFRPYVIDNHQVVITQQRLIELPLFLVVGEERKRQEGIPKMLLVELRMHLLV